MAISKKTRFEVFKRDNFTCGYCGNTPPAVILEVDHIKPKAKQGKDDINNLITSCFDCNRGKRDNELTRISPGIKENLEVLKEREEQLVEYFKYVNKHEKRIQRSIKAIDDVFGTYGYEFPESFKRGTLKTFLKNLTEQEIIHALSIALEKYNSHEDIERGVKYFCGICWNWIKKPETKTWQSRDL